MVPFRFGSPARRLFGIYQPGIPSVSPGSAVLLCNPFGQEAMRTHRLFRVLAERLCGVGVAVLRFDPYGTGDSDGQDDEGDFDGWCCDLRTAHEELLNRSGAVHVDWLGVRLGATVALATARQSEASVRRLVLWDPVVEGAAYLQYLRVKHVEALEEAYSLADPAWRRDLETNPNAFVTEAIGFGISPTLRSQLVALDKDALHIPARIDTHVIADPHDVAIQRWITWQRQAGVQLTVVQLAHTFDWTASSALNTALVPAQALQHLMKALRE